MAPCLVRVEMSVDRVGMLCCDGVSVDTDAEVHEANRVVRLILDVESWYRCRGNPATQPKVDSGIRVRRLQSRTPFGRNTVPMRSVSKQTHPAPYAQEQSDENIPPYPSIKSKP